MKQVYTNENKLKKELIIVSIITNLIALCMLAGVIMTTKSLNEAEITNIENELKSKTELYKTQIYRQLEADIQTLLTLGGFLDFDSSFNEEVFLTGFNNSKQNNKFIRMSYVTLSGTVYHVTLNEGVKIEKLSELNQNLQTIIYNSLNGDNDVSRIYYDHDLKRNVVAVSVPIINDSQEHGVLIAFNDTNEYEDIMEINIDKKLYNQIINIDGTILISSDNESFLSMEVNLFDKEANLFDKNEVSTALKNNEDYYVTLKIGSVNYYAYFSPMKYHNWYMCSIMPDYSVDSDVVKLISTSGILFLIIGILAIVYCYFLFKKNIKQLEKVAYYDPLTNAFNINKFRNIYENKLNSNLKGCIGILNVNKFQIINNTFGEVEANKLLCYISDILNDDIYEGEYFCRDNADQFIFYFKTNQEEVIKARLHAIQCRISRFYEEKKSNFDMKVSFGICVINNKQFAYQDVVNNALWALKTAKQSGESFVFFDDSLEVTINMENEIESSKLEALKNEEFKLFFQPKYNLQTGQLVGAEALVRWIKQDGKMIFPDQFVPLFEKNGFCVELDFYMVEKVCKQLHDWMVKGLEVYPVSINQSKLLFYRTDYVERLCEITSRYEIPHSLIVLEILEGLAVENIAMMNETIQKLHSQGFKVSLDDFGSGYSALNSLNQLIVDEIKIDRMFLKNINKWTDTNDLNILRQIIYLIKSLKISVIAEGVEKQIHVDILKEFNCSLGQGYYFSKPVSSLEFENYIEDKI